MSSEKVPTSVPERVDYFGSIEAEEEHDRNHAATSAPAPQSAQDGVTCGGKCGGDKFQCATRNGNPGYACACPCHEKSAQDGEAVYQFRHQQWADVDKWCDCTKKDYDEVFVPRDPWQTRIVYPAPTVEALRSQILERDWQLITVLEQRDSFSKALAASQQRVATFDQVFVEAANELGCRADNEQILAAIHALRQRVRELEGVDGWNGWRDVAIHGYPESAQEVLFVRGGKTVHGAFIGDIFWYRGQKCAAALWAPIPQPLTPDEHRALLASPAPAASAERVAEYWEWISKRFNDMKTSACERVMSDLGLNGIPTDTLESLVRAAIAKQSEESR